MAEEVVVKVKKREVQEKVSDRTNKPYKVLYITDDNNVVYSGFVGKDTFIPDQGDLAKLTVQPVELKSGTKLSIQKSEQVSEAEDTKPKTTSKAKTINDTISTTSTKEATVTCQQQPSNRDLSIETQAILKSLLETGAYTDKIEKEGRTYLNLNEGALKQHARAVLSILHDLVREAKNDNT